MKLKTRITRINKLIDEQEKIKHACDDRITKMLSKRRSFEIKLMALEKARRARCKHNGKMRYNKNMRDDASFDKYILCEKCNEWVGEVEFNGEERFHKDTI